MGWLLARAVVRRWIDAPEADVELDGTGLGPAPETPGLVWRLADEQGSAADLEVLDDPSLLLDLTVWEDAEALEAWVAGPDAAAVAARAAGRLTSAEAPAEVRWWVRDDDVPTVEDAEVRLARLRAMGPTAVAFGPDRPHAPPASR